MFSTLLFCAPKTFVDVRRTYTIRVQQCDDTLLQLVCDYYVLLFFSIFTHYYSWFTHLSVDNNNTGV